MLGPNIPSICYVRSCWAGRGSRAGRRGGGGGAQQQHSHIRSAVAVAAASPCLALCSTALCEWLARACSRVPGKPSCGCVQRLQGGSAPGSGMLSRCPPSCVPAAGRAQTAPGRTQWQSKASFASSRVHRTSLRVQRSRVRARYLRLRAVSCARKGAQVLQQGGLGRPAHPAWPKCCLQAPQALGHWSPPPELLLSYRALEGGALEASCR